MRIGVISSIILVVAWVILAIAQLWLQPLSAEVFFKVSVTAGVLLGLTVLLSLVIREYLSEQKMKDDGFIDG